MIGLLESPEFHAMHELINNANEHEVLLAVVVMLAAFLAIILIGFSIYCIKDKKEEAIIREHARLFEMERAEARERKRLAKCADWSSIAEREWESECPCL